MYKTKEILFNFPGYWNVEYSRIIVERNKLWAVFPLVLTLTDISTQFEDFSVFVADNSPKTLRKYLFEIAQQYVLSTLWIEAFKLWLTSLEDLGAATSKLVNFVDH